MQKREKIILSKIWDSQSDLWDKKAENSNDYYSKRSKYVVKIISRYVTEKCNILEGGCGAGLLSQLLLNIGFDVYAYDISPKMIEITRKRVIKNPNETFEHFRVCKNEEIPFNSMKFYLFIGMDLFPYIQNYNSYIMQISKVLRLKGLVIVSCNNRLGLFNFLAIFRHILRLGKIQNWGSTLINLIRTAYWSGGHVDYKTAKQVYDANSFDNLFSKNGFKKIDELSLFTIDFLDQNSLSRGHLKRTIARYFCWNYIGVYQKITEV